MASLRQILVFAMVYTSATLLGYDSGYLNGVIASGDFIRRYGVSDDNGVTWYLTAKTRSLFTSMFAPGTIIGCLLASSIPDRVGRKGTFLFASVFYAVGVSVQAAGPPAPLFIIGRVLLGIGLGMISIVTPVYLVEASSANTRGRTMAIYLQVLTCGNVLACGVSLATSNLEGGKSWRITIAFQLLLAVFVFIGAFIAPESPTILLRRAEPDRAAESIVTLRNLEPGSQKLNEALEEMKKWVAEQASFGKVNIMECFRGHDLRRTLIGVGMAFMTLSTGVTFWFGYGTTFFQAAGVGNSYLVSLILAAVNCIFSGPAIHLVEKTGRRTLVFLGGAIMAFAQLLTAILHSVAPESTESTNMLLAGSVLFIAAYASSWGPAGWLLMAEPYSARLRTQSTTVSMLLYWTTTWAIGFVTPYIIDDTAAGLGVNITYIWCAMSIIAVAWAFLCVPELSGLSTLEMDALFQQGVPAWKSKAWKKNLQVVEGTAVIQESVFTEMLKHKLSR